MKFSFPGLSDAAVVESRARHGSNTVTTQEVETFWDKFLDNLKDPIIVILIVALAITVTLAILTPQYVHWYEGVGIAIAVALATLIATWSEYRNENVFQELLEEASLIQVKVFRNGHLGEIPIGELVVGDYVLLQPGDTIPADGPLIAGHLDVSQAALTGESEAIRKQPLPGEDAPVDEERNQLWRASLVEDGEAVMRLSAVGNQTKYGETLNELISAEDRLSPLQQKLSILGKHISTFGYIGASFIALAFMYKHAFMDAASLSAYLALPPAQIVHHVVTALILAVVIIVVAVPEGLPMMIAIVLSLNMRKLLKAKVLVRKLLGIETAGSLTVLFSDKTGTLTQGHLAVAEFLSGEHTHHTRFDEIPETVRETLAYALRNNTSAVIDASNPDDIRLVGADRTEQAMLRFLGEALAHKDDVDIVEMIPFSSSRKFSAVQVRGPRNLTLVKGAPEIVLQNCTHYLDAAGNKLELRDKDALNAEMHTLSERAMRLLAVAVGEDNLTSDQQTPQDLTLVGICGLRDNLRDTSYLSVKKAHDAGIQVVMITGDSRETAEAIARDVGLLNDAKAQIITSSEMARLSDQEVKQLLPNLHVVARAFPTDKSRLVKLAKEMGWVVGMTGDGVNDAPAVKNADVGFAMGSGTEMTKEAGHIVILDDNFQSITEGVLYGRTLFKSIRKFLVFQLTVNVSAILLAFFGPFMGYDLPLTMIQLLWINLIMDTLAAIAFSGEAALERYMREKPIPRDAHLINGEMWSSILTNGLAATALSLVFLTYAPIKELFHSEAAFLTAFFGFFVFLHNFNKFNARTESLNLFDHLLENKNFLGIVALIFTVQIIFTYIGGDILRTVPLLPMEWLYILGMALLIIPIDLGRKLIRNALFGNPVKSAT